MPHFSARAGRSRGSGSGTPELSSVAHGSPRLAAAASWRSRNALRITTSADGAADVAGLSRQRRCRERGPWRLVRSAAVAGGPKGAAGPARTSTNGQARRLQLLLPATYTKYTRHMA